MLSDVFSDFDIVVCDDLFKGIQYICNHETLGHFSVVVPFLYFEALY